MTEGKVIQWYRTPIDKETLRELTRKSDWKGLSKAGGFLLLYLALVASSLAAFLTQSWVILVVVCYATSIVLNFIGMAAGVHELSHGTMFRTRWLNEAFYYVYCFLSWNNPVHFRASHGLHHQLTMFKDPDKEQPFGPVQDKLNWFHYVTWFTFDVEQFWTWTRLTVMHSLGFANADYFFWNPLFEKDDPRRGQMIAFARITLIGHLLLAVLFVSLNLWVLLFTVTFGVFFASWYAKFCGALQHTGLPDSTADWRLVCHSFAHGPLTRFLYWNMNFHIEHHMYAAVPNYHLPKLHRALAHDLPKGPKSLWAGLALLRRIKARQKADPLYRWLPELPT